MKSRILKIGFGLCLILSAILGCTKKKAELGTAENPIKFYFVPSVDVKVLSDSTKLLQDYLEKATPYKFQTSIPTSFVAVVEAFGTNRADVASINTFGYILANERYQAEARLILVRHGDSTYRSQILVRADSPIKKLEDLAGKKIAYVDPASTSGYLLPAKLLRDKNIKPKETMFAMRHDSVVSMVYQGQVDAGATYHSPIFEGQLQDARHLVKTQYPDIEDKVKILSLSEAIPNDPIVFRRDMPEEMKQKIIQALVAYIATPEGKKAFMQVAGVTDLKIGSDRDYDPVRSMLKELGKSAMDMHQ